MTWLEEATPGGWSFHSIEHGAHIILDYIYPAGRGLEAWVECRVDNDPLPLAAGQRNMMLPTAAQPFLAMIGESTVPWAEGFRLAFHHTINAWRAGAMTLDLALVEPSDLSFLVDPLLEEGGNTRLIAPGGYGKSIFAMAMALTIATGSRKFLGMNCQKSGPAVYLDWETNASTHARRIKALCDPIGMPQPGSDLIWYREESVPLYRSIEAVQRTVNRTGAIAVIVDSRALAAGASSQSSGEDATLNLNTALREVGVPALIVDHKNKEDIRKDRRGGIGSVFNQNLARMEWEYRYYRRTAPNERQFVLSLEKENNVGDLPDLGYRMVTEGGKQGITSAQFIQIPPEGVRDAGVADDIGERVLLLFGVSDEPMTVAKIAELTGVKEASLRARLNNDDRFENVRAGRQGSPGLWRPKEEYLTGGPLESGEQDGLLEPRRWRDDDNIF